jgi:cystathionine beta-synthase
MLELIGNTPLIKLNKVTENLGIYKVEAFNPGHSSKTE